MFTVHYTDDCQEETYATIEEAQAGIEETVLGCDFAVGVESVTDSDGKEYGCTWSVTLEVSASAHEVRGWIVDEDGDWIRNDDR